MNHLFDKCSWRKQEYRRRIGSIRREQNNKKMKEYQKTPRGIISRRAVAINMNARFRNIRGKITGVDLIQIIYAQGGDLGNLCICAICKTVSGWQQMVWNHIYPFCAGGLNTKSNLQLICQPCHHTKSANERKARGMFGAGIKFAQSPIIESQLTLQLDAI